MFAVTASIIVRNTRTAGTLAAFAGFLVSEFRTAPPAGVLEALVVFLPALEVALFAAVFAIVRDDETDAPPAAAALAFVLWAVVVLAAIWLVVRGTQAGIDAYVEFGLPPVFSVSV
ncbi:MAG: hypothetical protein RH982_13460 [Parvibaculum sp.]